MSDKFDILLEDEGWEELNEAQLFDKFWDPEPGDEIVGFYKGTREVQGKYGTNDVMIVETEDLVYAVNMNDVLKDCIEYIKKGDGIYIKYLGMKRTKDGLREYKNYQVKIKRL